MVAMALGSIWYALLFVCTFGLQYSCGQLQPRISEAFYSEYRLVQEGTVITAVAYHNLDAGKDRTVHMMGDGKGRVNFLIRLDQQAAYQYYEPYNYCSITERGNITIPNFDWVQYSSYRQSMDFYGQNVAVWVYQEPGYYQEMGVSATNKNIPVFYFRSDGREESFSLTIFDVFTPGPPDDSKFDIPPSCREPNVQQKVSVKAKPVHQHTDEDIQQIRSSLFRKVDALMK